MVNHEKTVWPYTIDDAVQRLSQLPHYKIVQRGEGTVHINVGNKWKYRMLGVYLTTDYFPPMDIILEVDGQDSGKTLMYVSGPKSVVDFFEKNKDFIGEAYERIVETMKA